MSRSLIVSVLRVSKTEVSDRGWELEIRYGWLTRLTTSQGRVVTGWKGRGLVGMFRDTSCLPFRVLWYRQDIKSVKFCVVRFEVSCGDRSSNQLIISWSMSTPVINPCNRKVVFSKSYLPLSSRRNYGVPSLSITLLLSRYFVLCFGCSLVTLKGQLKVRDLGN